MVPIYTNCKGDNIDLGDGYGADVGVDEDVDGETPPTLRRRWR